MAPDLLTLEDEEGQEHLFEIVDQTEIDGQEYYAVCPYAPTARQAAAALEEDAELLMLRVSEEAGERYFDLIEDDEEFYRVGEVFSRRLSELYEIGGEELPPS